MVICTCGRLLLYNGILFNQDNHVKQTNLKIQSSTSYSKAQVQLPACK